MTRALRKRSFIAAPGALPGRDADRPMFNALTVSALRNPALLISTLGYATVLAARDLSISSAHAAGYLRRARRHVLGPRGLQPRSLMTDEAGNPDRDQAAILEEWWRDWSLRADDRGRCSMRQLQDLMLTSYLRDGEILVRTVVNAGRLTVRVLDVFDMPFLWSQGAWQAQGVIGGVELDRRGRPVSYLLDDTPDAMRSTGYAGVESGAMMARVPARWIVHVVDNWGFPTAVRGLSRFAPTAQRLGWLQRYERAALKQAARAASVGGFLREDESDMAADMDTAPEDEAGDGYAAEYMPDLADQADGAFWRLAPGLRFESLEPNKPEGGDFSAFCQGQLHAIAAALGTSYGGLSGDFARSNYSSSRAALVDEADEWETVQQLLGESVLSRLWRLGIEIAVAGGQLTPVGDLAAWIARAARVAWAGPAMKPIDPAKDAAAVNQRLRNGTLSLSGAIRHYGLDPEQVFTERARDAERLKELGLETVTDGPAPPVPDKEKDDDDD